MNITGTIAGVNYDRKYNMILQIKVTRGDINAFDEFGDKELDIDMQIKSKKRSRTANAYMWALCTDIAAAIGDISKDDVYRNAIIERGIFRDFHQLTEAECKTLKAAWEQLGTGWITQPLDYEPDGEHRILRCYYGSSRYNARQMRRLIEGLEEDARSFNITLITPYEKDLLLDEWDELQKKEKNE